MKDRQATDRRGHSDAYVTNVIDVAIFDRFDRFQQSLQRYEIRPKGQKSVYAGQIWSYHRRVPVLGEPGSSASLQRSFVWGSAQAFPLTGARV